MRRIIAGLALALLLVAPASAAASAAAAPTGAISVDQANPAYQTIVTFTVTVSKKYDCVGRVGCARVLVECLQSGNLVYGEAGSIAQARGSGDPLGYSGFLLGGSGSIWVYDNPNTPADCVATLFYFDNNPAQTFNVIATTSFHAEG